MPLDVVPETTARRRIITDVDDGPQSGHAFVSTPFNCSSEGAP